MIGGTSSDDSTLGLTAICMRHIACLFGALFVSAGTATAQAQQPAESPKVPGYTIEITPLPPAATRGITELPLQVDMALAEQFVKLGYGPQILGQRGFQSTQFLTPELSTKQAAQLVRVVPEYGKFKGDRVAEGILRFAGRVSGVQFGREGSPVLYIHLPYWTHQTEGPINRGKGSRISDEENERLVAELRKVFVSELGAQEFGPDEINKRKIRIWWHHS
jgi:hypothetical protein